MYAPYPDFQLPIGTLANNPLFDRDPCVQLCRRNTFIARPGHRHIPTPCLEHTPHDNCIRLGK